jgi:hypothetical protein
MYFLCDHTANQLNMTTENDVLSKMTSECNTLFFIRRCIKLKCLNKEYIAAAISCIHFGTLYQLGNEPNSANLCIHSKFKASGANHYQQLPFSKRQILLVDAVDVRPAYYHSTSYTW